MTRGAPAAPDDGPAPPHPHPVEIPEAEKLAAQWEARHDVAARGSRGDPMGVQHYLAHARIEESREHAPPDHPHPGGPPPVDRVTVGPPVTPAEPVAVRDSRRRLWRRWFRRSGRR